MLQAATRVMGAVLVIGAVSATAAADSPPPNWVPKLDLGYVAPGSSRELRCESPCRRFEVPAGATLIVRVSIDNTGGEPRVGGPPWDLWWDQRLHPFPGFDTAACFSGDPPRIDASCWSDLLQRVEWLRWRDEVPDLTCVPEVEGACREVVLRVPVGNGADAELQEGVHSLAVWVDRFGGTAEGNELDNFAGPIRLVVTAETNGSPEHHAVSDEAPSVVERQAEAGTVRPGTPGQPFAIAVVPATDETGFALTSDRAHASLPFVIGQPGDVSVEVSQIGGWDEISIEIRKVSNGAVLQRARGRGRVQLEGFVGKDLLRDDRGFEVLVSPDRGSRGARGTIRVQFPFGARLIAE